MKYLFSFILMLTSIAVFAQRCAFDDIHAKLLARDPEYKARVEAMNAQWAKQNDPRMSGLVTTTGYGTEYQIPIVVHVIHTGGAIGTTYNPTDAAINATITYLNESFAATYSGYVDTNSGGVRFPVKFVLAQRDPNCATTTGIVRVDGSGIANYTARGVNADSTNGASETTVKALSRWNNKAYYNIWVVNKIDSKDGTSGSFIAGYAYFPGASYTIDGTIMLATQMSAGSVTLPHEMGHAFGLYHTFQGDGTGSTCPTNSNCSTDGDLICDTEPHKRNLGTCASGTTNTCVSATYSDAAAKNIMNYCTCPNRFTSGQRTRFINTLLAYRKGLMSSMALLSTSTNVVSASCSTTTTNALHTANMGPISVSFNDLKNITSGAYIDGANYIDYTCNLRANLIQGQTYTLQVATYLNGQNKSVWIDYDNSGTFTVSERVANFGFATYGTSADTDWHSTSVLIPTSGVTTCTPLRMRVMSDWGGASALPTTGCGTLAYGQTEDYTVYIKPASGLVTSTITGTNPICTGGGRGVYSVTPSATLTSPSYQWYKNSQAVGTNSATYSATGVVAGDYIQCKINYSGVCSSNADSVFSNILAITGTVDTNTWTGQTSTSMATTTNWSCGALPSASTTAYFPKSGVVNLPAGTSGTYTAKNLWIDDNGSLALSSGVTISVKETVTLDTATITGAGRIILNGTSAQTITGRATISNLELNNSTGATINSGTQINITDTYTPTSGTLTTNSGLILKSSSGGTARIAAGSGTYISGNVTQERYIPGGKRGLRWLAHPFSTTLNLSDLIDDIDITGSGGATNGFTSTSSTAPSAFWFDVATADNNTNRSNAGWAAFTTANGTGSNNTWTQYEGVSILVRGTPGQGLGTPVTPSAVTLDLTGAVNQGSKVVTVTKGSGSVLALVGNPFPSQIDINATTRGGGISAGYYIWDPNSGTKGAFVAKLFSSSFIMPSGTSFMTLISATSTITFPESCKSSTTPTTTMYKSTGIANGVQFKLTSNSDSITWDQWDMYFDNNAAADSEWYDVMKLMNPEVSMYSFAKDGARLAIDSRPYAENEIIPMGLAYATPRTYTLRVEDIDMPVNTQLYLHDKYLNTVVELKQGGSYVFDVTIDSLTYGDNRFELNMLGNPTNSSIAKNKLKVQLVPNPATNNATLYYEGMQDGNIEVNITNMVGIKVATYVQASVKTGSINIPLQQVASGIYIVEVKNGNQTITQKLVKQ